MRRVALFIAGMTATVVTPCPRQVVKLTCVVQDAPAQAAFRSGWVMFLRARQQLVKTWEALGPINKVEHRFCFFRCHAGRDINKHKMTHQLRVRTCKRETREATKRHTNNGSRVWRKLLH